MTGGSAHQKRGSARTLCPLADAATPFAGGAPGAESVESAAFLILPGIRYPVPPTRAYPEHRRVGSSRGEAAEPSAGVYFV